MKKLLLISGVLLTLISCQNNDDKDSITKFVVLETQNTLSNLTSYIYKAVKKEGNRSSDLRVLAYSQKLESLRNSVVKEHNRESLLAYSDTVSNSYIQIFDEGGQISKQLIRNKQLVLNSTDTLNHLDLFFWTLKAEEAIQTELATKVGSTTDYFMPLWVGKKIELFLNGENFKVGDTVYATFQVSNDKINTLKFNFDSLAVKHTILKQQIPRTIIKSGPNFIIQTVPNQSGKFSIEGKIKVVDYSGREWNHYLTEAFNVN